MWVVWLYGSRARGDADQYSDTDILFVGDRDKPEKLERVVSQYRNPVLSEYRWAEIESMAGYGSLYLWHIKSEGRCLLASTSGAKRFERVLAGLERYKNGYEDIASFRRALEDVRSASTDLSSPEQELSNLAVTVRHAAILGSYIIGSPCFERNASVELVAKRWNLKLPELLPFCEVYGYRQVDVGKADGCPPARWKFVKVWGDFLEVLLERIETELDADEYCVL